MLLDDLYSVNIVATEKKDDIQAKVDINPSHNIFKGHFPDRPVMPGVCLTNMLTDTISVREQKDYYLASADYIKFINVVLPDQVQSVNIQLKITSSEATKIWAEGSILSGTTTYLKFKGCFHTK